MHQYVGRIAGTECCTNEMLNEINESKVKESIDKLEDSYDTFLKLHDRYLEYGCPSVEAEAVQFKSKGSTYLKEVSDAFSTMNRRFVKFQSEKEKQSLKTANETKLSSLNKEVSWLKTNLEGEAAAAKTVVASEETNLRKTARTVKNSLMDSLDKYCEKVKEYETLIAVSEDQEEGKYSEVTDYLNVVNTVKSLGVQLEAIALEHSGGVPEASDKSKSEKVSTPGTESLYFTFCFDLAKTSTVMSV